MTFAILQLLLVQLILPAVFIFSLWKASFQNKLEWMIQALFTVVFIFWVYSSGRWDWVSYYLRFVWLILLVAAVYRSWKNVRPLPFRTPFSRKQKWSIGLYVVLALVFGLYNVWTFSGYTTDNQAIELEFPLKSGVYYIGQGGNHVQINYHNAYPKQKYALDIVELNKWGLRAAGLYPSELEKYVIFGDQVYSPCSGKIMDAEKQLLDLIPPDTNSEQPGGNHVIISCEKQNAKVFIAHMQENSVMAKEGDTIQKGEPIGLVGNSGNTSEPHLHIHAVRDGKGVPITFDGKFLVRNSLVWE
ncbi:M23 family metallopeptidase [Virgibacillus siamensis]|uniref:M23 family metallopeptidase n=1 Tax=Virgibacillus siamensis TaxID=480071 RepID=A0ABN1GM49_9BACI